MIFGSFHQGKEQEERSPGLQAGAEASAQEPGRAGRQSGRRSISTGWLGASGEKLS
ncbi:MAG: hypothetical protein HN542_10780 [Flavobacteriales bacterium]|nr:hypothetical protein [Flavobacteriales bacterium]